MMTGLLAIAGFVAFVVAVWGLAQIVIANVADDQRAIYSGEWLFCGGSLAFFVIVGVGVARWLRADLD